MSKITITLEVTPVELAAIATVLRVTPEPYKGPVSLKEEQQDQSPVKPTIKPSAAADVVTTPTPKPGGKTSAKMPAFGRTQAQVNEFLENESTRVTALDEKAELKAQRAEEKAAIASEKEAEAAKITKELEDIKAADTSANVTTTIPAKLWNL